MAGDVTDTWLVGVVAHDDALSSLRVHAGYVGAGPTSGRDHRLQVRLRYGDRADPAFPDADASAALIAAEERIVGRVGDAAVLVGVLTVPGFRDLVFHTDDPDGCGAALADAASDDAWPHGVDVADVDRVADPAWSLYRSLFADAVPADADRRRIHEAAATSGESSPERRIEHRFQFPTLAEADQAAAALREADLQVRFEQADDTAEAAPPRFAVVESEVLTQVDMARSRDLLRGFATSWGGDYLGWRIDGPSAAQPSDASE